MALFNIINVNIPASGTLSEIVAVKTGAPTAIIAPATITSGQLMLRGNYDTTSAGFVAMWRTDGASRWAWNVGAGQAAIGLDAVALSFPFIRLESSVAQAGVQSFAVVQRF